MNIWDFFAWFFWIYVAFSCIWLFITVLIDVFRDHSLGGGAKALWTLFLIVLPFLGSLIYLIARGSGMSARAYQGRGIVPEPTDYTPSFGS
jgi:hypothetical protein